MPLRLVLVLLLEQNVVGTMYLISFVINLVAGGLTAPCNSLNQSSVNQWDWNGDVPAGIAHILSLFFFVKF